jgi:hypothetical protein
MRQGLSIEIDEALVMLPGGVTDLGMGIAIVPSSPG